MKAAKPVFVCQECGAQAPKWMGRCPGCGEWNTLQEEPAAALLAIRPFELAPDLTHDYSLAPDDQRHRATLNGICYERARLLWAITRGPRSDLTTC